LSTNYEKKFKWQFSIEKHSIKKTIKKWYKFELIKYRLIIIKSKYYGFQWYNIRKYKLKYIFIWYKN
jgi:hypothetical protein